MISEVLNLTHVQDDYWTEVAAKKVFLEQGSQ